MDLSRVLAAQDGVVSRAQLLEGGLQPHDVLRMVRRRQLSPVHTGVYVNHTGPLSDRQRLWAASLAVSEGVLAGRAAQWLGGMAVPRGSLQVVELVAPFSASGRHELEGIEVRRRRGWESLVVVGSPARLRVEDATVDLADAASDELGVVDELTRAVQSRRTTAERLLVTARERSRLCRRAFLTEVLGDVVTGVCSVLEHGYLTRVERPHGLPVGRRQVRVVGPRGRSAFEDVEYDGGLVMELDGRLGHDSARGRDADFDRDLEAAADGRRTSRISYGQVYGRACWTAERVGRLLRTVCGWDGEMRACPSCA